MEGDCTAAAHYGYKIDTIRADMRDLSEVADGSFDLVYQGPSMSWISNVREVYSEVAKVLRPGGAYRTSQPYVERLFHPENGLYDYRHYMGDIFNRS
ncbi:MAG: SAM-dependent methyltransferase [Candidatus Latescibacterota bacterium]